MKINEVKLLTNSQIIGCIYRISYCGGKEFLTKKDLKDIKILAKELNDRAVVYYDDLIEELDLTVEMTLIK